MTSTIEFKLFAPRNIGAALIGSFSEWKEIQMEKGEDGYFRTQIALEDGVYQYKIRVQTKSQNFEPDQWVDVIDPYATDVSETVTQPKKIAWPLWERDLNRNLFEYYKKLITLRKQNSALPSNNIEFFHENPEAKVLAYTRWNDQGSRVVVVANFYESLLSGYKVSNFPADGIWHEWIGNYDIEARENEIAINLPEYEARVFVLQP